MMRWDGMGLEMPTQSVESTPAPESESRAEHAEQSSRAEQRRDARCTAPIVTLLMGNGGAKTTTRGRREVAAAVMDVELGMGPVKLCPSRKATTTTTTFGVGSGLGSSLGSSLGSEGGRGGGP